MASRLSQIANTYMLQSLKTGVDKYLFNHLKKKQFLIRWDQVLHTILETIKIDSKLTDFTSRRVLNYITASKAYYGFI